MPMRLDVSARLAQEMLDELARPDHAGIRDLGRSPLLLTLLCLNYAETLIFPPAAPRSTRRCSTCCSRK